MDSSCLAAALPREVSLLCVGKCVVGQSMRLKVQIFVKTLTGRPVNFDVEELLETSWKGIIAAVSVFSGEDLIPLLGERSCVVNANRLKLLDSRETPSKRLPSLPVTICYSIQWRHNIIFRFHRAILECAK